MLQFLQGRPGDACALLRRKGRTEPSAAAGDCARAVGAAESHKLNASIETEDNVPFAFISLPILRMARTFSDSFESLIRRASAPESQA